MSRLDDQILDIIAATGRLDRAAVTGESRLDTLGLSSLDLVEILFEIEDRLDVRIEHDAAAAMQSGPALLTVQDVIDAVAERVAAREPDLLPDGRSQQ